MLWLLSVLRAELASSASGDESGLYCLLLAQKGAQMFRVKAKLILNDANNVVFRQILYFILLFPPFFLSFFYMS